MKKLVAYCFFDGKLIKSHRVECNTKPVLLRNGMCTSELALEEVHDQKNTFKKAFKKQRHHIVTMLSNSILIVDKKCYDSSGSLPL